MAEVIQKGVLRVCCANPANLRAEQLTESLLVKVCRECSRRHFEAKADPARIGLRFD
jgi:hypothetical protein